MSLYQVTQHVCHQALRQPEHYLPTNNRHNDLASIIIASCVTT